MWIFILLVCSHKKLKYLVAILEITLLNIQVKFKNEEKVISNN